MRYRVNEPQVIFETIGDEAMVVNLATGHYFNLQGAGIDAWEGIARGLSVSEILSQLSGRYEAADGEIEASVSQLLAELEGEGLIVEAEGGAQAPAAQPSGPNGAGKRLPFTMPALAKFTDMQDIILLDPVHEVDARGWPHAPTGV